MIESEREAKFLQITKRKREEVEKWEFVASVFLLLL